MSGPKVVRIVSRERFSRGGIRRAKNEQRAVRRIAERARHHELAAVLRTVDEAQMLFSIRHATRDEAVDDVVQQCKVFHEIPFRASREPTLYNMKTTSRPEGDVVGAPLYVCVTINT